MQFLHPSQRLHSFDSHANPQYWRKFLLKLALADENILKFVHQLACEPRLTVQNLHPSARCERAQTTNRTPPQLKLDRVG